MDLHNNHMGRVYAERYPNLSEIDLFWRAMANGNIITCVEEVQEIFGFRNDHIFSNEYGNARHVLIFMPRDSTQPLSYMTMRDFERRNRN